MRSIDKYSGGHEIYIIDGNLNLHTPNTATTKVVSTLESTSCTTGAFVVAGGVGIGKDLYVCGGLTVGGTLSVDEIVPESGTTITIGDEGTTEVTITAPDGEDGGTITIDAGEDGTVEIEGTLDYDGELTLEGDLALEDGAGICFATESGSVKACIFATDDLWSADSSKTSNSGYKNFYGHDGSLVISLKNLSNHAARGGIEEESEYANHDIKRAGIVIDNSYHSTVKRTADGGYQYYYSTGTTFDPKIRYASPCGKKMFLSPSAFQYTNQWSNPLEDSESGTARLGFAKTGGWSDDEDDWFSDKEGYQKRYTYAWEFTNRNADSSGCNRVHTIAAELPVSIPDGSIVYGIQLYFTLDSQPKICEWSENYFTDNVATTTVPTQTTWKVRGSTSSTYVRCTLYRLQVDGQYEDGSAGGGTTYYDQGYMGAPNTDGNAGGGSLFHNTRDVMGAKLTMDDSNPTRGSFGLRVGDFKCYDTSDPPVDLREPADLPHEGDTVHEMSSANIRSDDGDATKWKQSKEGDVDFMEIQRSEYAYFMNIAVGIRQPYSNYGTSDYTENGSKIYGTAIRFSGCKIYYATDNPCDPAGGNRDESRGNGTGHKESYYGAVTMSSGTKRSGSAEED